MKHDRIKSLSDPITSASASFAKCGLLKVVRTPLRAAMGRIFLHGLS